MSRHLGPEFDRFLKDVLPGMGLDWRRHRRRGVRRKVAERLRSRGIRSLDDYRRLLEKDPAEKSRFLTLLGVTISRFFRDARVFAYLADSVWPRWTDREKVAMLSVGCAGGEEPYSLAMLWRERGPGGVRPVILALDMDAESLVRAGRGLYPGSSLRELPDAMKSRFFSADAGQWRLADDIKAMVGFFRADFRAIGPPSNLDLVLCRNLVYTYFDRDSRRRASDALAAALRPGGILVVGLKEQLEKSEYLEWIYPCVYRKTKD